MSDSSITSTLTDRYQTTIPLAVRQQLGLGKRDQLSYRIGAGGEVLIARAQAQVPDPVLGTFLQFLENDLRGRPQALRALDDGMYQELSGLMGDLEVDLEAALDLAVAEE